MLPSTVREQLSDRAEQADRSSDWPEESWNLIRETGRLAYSIPGRFGGVEVAPAERLRNMEEIGASCLTTAFILSQREAAVRQILKAPEDVQSRYLPALAKGEAFLTVGLSQLTTSRQHLGPALRATPHPTGGYELNGEIPWVTGADQANAIVAGATLADGRQILVVIPAERLVGMIEAPLPLAALVGSRTSLIRCRNVVVEAKDLIAGPTENVLGKLGGGGLDTSTLAIALSSATIDYLGTEALKRPELVEIHDRFESTVAEYRKRLYQLSETDHEPSETLALRTDCTKFVLRVTQTSLMVAKGNGFVVPHPVQRWTRQALFFLVWSCPRPVAEGVLADLTSW